MSRTKRRFGLARIASAAAAVLAIACGGAQAPAPEASGGSAARPGDEACMNYAQRLCEELGPRSESCRSVIGVVTFMPPRACDAGIADFDVTRSRIADLRKACDEVVQKVCDVLGEDSDSCVAIRQDLPQIPPGHCQALQRDQDQLLAALQQREAQSAPVGEQEWQALIAADGPSFGASDAKVVIVEFSDFQCPFCAQAARTLQRLKDEYGERVRFVFRQYPLPFHPNAHAAAQAALAAHDQGKFWAYHDMLFDNQDELERQSLFAYAQRLGLDMEAFASAAEGSDTAGRIKSDIELGESVNVRGTPTMFVNKQRVENPIDFEDVSGVIDQALEAAQ